jgi:hypothetical protein
MIIIQNHLHAIATAMNWQVLDPFGNSVFGHKQLLEYIKTGGQIGISYKNGKDINLGVGTDIHLNNVNEKNIISIAHHVAMHGQMRERSLVALLKNTISQDESIFAIGLINGNVVIDQLVEKTEIDQIVNDFHNINIFTNNNVDIFGDIAPDQFNITNFITLEDILKDTNNLKKYVTALKNSLISFYLILTIILVLLAYFFFGIWHESVLSGESLISNKLKAINSSENIYTQRINVFLKTPIHLANKNIGSTLTEIGSFPFELAKWRLRSIDCNKYICTVNWLSIGGSYEDFIKAALPAWSNINLLTDNGSLLGDNNSLQSNFSISGEQELLPEFVDLPKFESFTFQMGDLLRGLSQKGWDSTLKAPFQIETPHDATDLSIKTHPLAILAIPWSSTNQGWRETELALQEFTKVCTLDEIKLTFNNQQPLLSTSGKCYVKK